MMKSLFSCTGNTTGNESQLSAPRTYSLIRGHRQLGKCLTIVDIQARHLHGIPVGEKTKYPVRMVKPSTSKVFSAKSMYSQHTNRWTEENGSVINEFGK